MNRPRFLLDPLEGRTSIGKVVWLYGVLGSLAYGMLGLLFDAADERSMRLYNIGGLLLSLYVTVATYQCARNCKTAFGRRLVRICAVLTLALLPLVAYLEFSASLSISSGLEGV